MDDFMNEFNQELKNLSLTPARLLFMLAFLEPRSIESLPEPPGKSWRELLNETPSEVLSFFKEKGLIVRSSLFQHLNHKFTVTQIKPYLEKEGLLATGNKQDLIGKWIDKCGDSLWELVGELEILKCSEKGEWLLKRINSANLEVKIGETNKVIKKNWYVNLGIKIGEVVGGGLLVNWLYDLLTGNDYREEKPLNEKTRETFKESSAKPKYSYFDDPRDGQRYRTVLLNGQIWMAQNLNYEVLDSWCYENNPANCEEYGRLYTWQAAMKACPQGWHLPTYSEWFDLAVFYSEHFDWMKLEIEQNPKRAYQALIKGGITGFDALLGGLRNSESGNFFGLGKYGEYWSASEAKGRHEVAKVISFYGGSSNVTLHTFERVFTLKYIIGPMFMPPNMGMGYSCRCVKD